MQQGFFHACGCTVLNGVKDGPLHRICCFVPVSHAPELQQVAPILTAAASAQVGLWACVDSAKDVLASTSLSCFGCIGRFVISGDALFCVCAGGVVDTLDRGGQVLEMSTSGKEAHEGHLSSHLHTSRAKRPWDYVEQRPSLPAEVVQACLLLQPDGEEVVHGAPQQGGPQEESCRPVGARSYHVATRVRGHYAVE
jgi:hypothetical protein